MSSKRKREILQSINVNRAQFKGFNLLNLPSQIIIEILIKVPPKDVIRCRCVCKTLYKLMSDPHFANIFLSKAPFTSAIHQSGNDIIFRQVSGYGELAEFPRTLKEITAHFVPKMENVELLGCSNGFVCFWNKSSLFGKSLYITNPALGQFAALPKPFSDKYVSIKETFWFGYVAEMRCYKVIRIRVRKALIPESNPSKFFMKSEVHVLVVGSKIWNYVGDAPFPLHGKFCRDILDGCIHWLVDDDKNSLKLHSFNVVKDRASMIPAPPALGNKCYFIELGVLGKYFSLIECSSDLEHIEIWSMKDYGVASSWTKDFILNARASELPSQYELSLPYLKYGEIEITPLWDRLFSYDPRNNKHGIITFGRAVDRLSIHIPSLLSLTDVSNGTRLRVKNLKSYSFT